MRTRFTTLSSPVVVHGHKTTILTLGRAGLVQPRREYAETRNGHRWLYYADYLPDCDAERGITEGWRIAYATYQALLRRGEREVPVPEPRSSLSV
ncbi:hypothetical protein [Sulfobacillus harzensis]|uniref:Uncharacterized protein n=1 Tax=Sulfobacillus harzensis TaxID=2729629 RepID=A0A7Y0L8K4_9FIRM|nr:hypothetical protein [Sulfobacillus harzensis]NMP25146.1 hypothetical protein [Sulfobacillus harzensis]